MKNQRGSGRMLAEFEPHRRTYLLWPSRPDNWRENALYGQRDMADLANLVAQYEPVSLGYNTIIDPTHTFSFHENVELFKTDYDDIWVRDTGPIFVANNGGRVCARDFRFNSWGGLFDASLDDDAVAGRIASREQIDCERVEVVLEGGAVATDGAGTIILTEESFLTANRNPGLSRLDAERILRQALCIDQVIWLACGLANDEAGGHVDNVCAFASETQLVVADTDDVSHPSYDRLKHAQEILLSARNTEGHRYQVARMPLPPATEITRMEAEGFEAAQGTIKRATGTPLAPSHVNFYVANGLVVVPTFDCATDAQALSVAEQYFRGRRVVAFPARELLLGGGAVHCLTRDIPYKKLNTIAGGQ